jgi:hypothetical protein
LLPAVIKESQTCLTAGRHAKFYLIVFKSFESWRICGKKKKYDFSE